MGQAWCREKTSKAQDSKSPLDRVFLRCAHRIYPGLKEDGSVLGGATQRVTSSEIGYASSPPRSALTRGCSIDSVDRPFHPSEWVDVNLEVPGTPGPEPTRARLSADASLRPAASSYATLKDVTPVPPPRKRKRNRGRPLPPKPCEVPVEGETGDDPLYSSVKCNYSNAEQPTRRTKEVYEHKVNGTGRVIPSFEVSRLSGSFDKRISDVKSHRKLPGDDGLFDPADSGIADSPRNCSSCSLPNCNDPEEEAKIRNVGTPLAQKKEQRGEETHAGGAIGRRHGEGNSISDSADFADPPLKLDSAMRTSTPLKDAIGDDAISRTRLDEWMRKREGDSNSFTELGDYHTAVGDISSTNATEPRRLALRRTLSNESEPFESFEEKELSLQPFGQLVRTISEESLPQEMLEDVVDAIDVEPLKGGEIDFFEERTTCEEPRSGEETISRTPPPSPEPKIKAQIVENDHHPSLSSKIKRTTGDQKDDDGSNLSSMTPSLTELEAALSDMLEKKEEEETEKDEESVEGQKEEEKFETDGVLEPKIVPIKKEDMVLILEEKKVEIVGFDFKKKPNVSVTEEEEQEGESEKKDEERKVIEPPEKPSRTRRISLEEPTVETAPTPPRRRNRSVSSSLQKDISESRDRLI